MLVLRHPPLALPALGLVAAIAWPREARAQSSHMVSPGISLGVSFGERTSFSIGLDVRYSFLPKGESCGGTAFGGGAFGQAALLIGSGGVAGRFAAGAHGGGGVPSPIVHPAAEIGWTYRTAYRATTERPEIPGWHGLHLGIHGWFFPLEELSVRGAIPLGGPPGALPEMTVAVGARFPPPYGFNSFCVSGRPLRNGDGVLLPPVLASDACEAREPASATQAALAEAWLDDARNESASIPAFLALARDLANVGAPSALVARALGAAEDEAVHTLLCSAVASQISGTLAAPALLAPPPAAEMSREEALVQLAVESWRDGCLGEGAAAERARRAIPRTRHALARAALTRIAVDEQRHADLAWDVLRFCAARGGRAVEDAIAAEIAADTASHADTSGGDRRLDGDAWRAHGRLDGAAITAAWEDRCAAARRDGGRILLGV
ncbi:putative lipoprotein [Minicystis rosea]|nr:putative lipoprotein [Minicystis rosea]